jgi:hypothetical protein
MSFVKSLTRLPRGDSSTRSILTVLLTFALAVSGAIVAPSANAAAPASPTSFTSTSFNDNGNSYDLRINFNRPDSSTVTLTRILYQSSSSAPWTYCRTQNGYTTCVWDETSSEVVIAKESTNSASLTKTTTYDFRFKLCTGGSSITDTADQVDCTPVYIVNYNYSTGGVIQSVSTPSISTNDTITTGATGATINVTGNDFSPSVTSSNFTITLGTTSLSLSNFSSPDSRTAIFTFSGTVNYGNLTIRAETSAYATTPSSVSNTLTISAPNIAPNAPTQLDSTTVTGTDVGLTWIAPSANGGSAVNGYVIYKKLGSGGTWETVTTTSNTNTTYTLTGLTSASNYYFKVAAKTHLILVCLPLISGQ